MMAEASMEENSPTRSTVARHASGYVLAGGTSSRMGRNKAMLPWRSSAGKGQTLLAHAVDRLLQVCATTSICGDAASLQAGNSAQPMATKQTVRFLPDALPGTGPLGGVVAALEQTATDWNLFLAVDLPLVPVSFLQSLLARTATSTGELLCVVPLLAGMPQPLCSLLHRSLAPGLRRALQAGQYKLMLAFRTAVAQTVSRQPESSPLDLWDIQDVPAPTLLRPEEWFLNVNTPADWEHAQKLAAGESGREPTV